MYESYLIQHDCQDNGHHIEIFALAAPIPRKMKSTGALGTVFHLTNEAGLYEWLNNLERRRKKADINGTWFSISEPNPSHKLVIHLTQSLHNRDAVNDPELLLLEDDNLLTNARFLFDWTIRNQMLVTEEGVLVRTQLNRLAEQAGSLISTTRS